MPNNALLERILFDSKSVLVGYSGGVDSTLVAVVAREVLGADATVAALGVSPSLSREQHDQAVDLANRFDLSLVEVHTSELDDPDYVANRLDRCYHCKHELWHRLTRLRENLGMRVVADGTNADDLADDRPGFLAGREFDIRSPLAEAGYTKQDVRKEARRREIPIWASPASPCLSSRVLFGLSVTPQRLSQVERAESFLRRLGVDGDLRVRHRGDAASIEVEANQFSLIRRQLAVIEGRFADLGFSRVDLDTRSYRSGSLRHDSEELKR